MIPADISDCCQLLPALQTLTFRHQPQLDHERPGHRTAAMSNNVFNGVLNDVFNGVYDPCRLATMGNRFIPQSTLLPEQHV